MVLRAVYAGNDESVAAVIATIVKRVLESFTQVIEEFLCLRDEIGRRVDKRVHLVQLVALNAQQPIFAYLKFLYGEWARGTIRPSGNELCIVQVIE